MTIRKRAFIIFGLTVASLILTLFATSHLILARSFARLEERDTREHVERALSALADNLATLSFKAADWAMWDDTYAFIEDGNETYIRSNLGDRTFSGLQINVMLFIHSSGRIVFGKAFDLENEEEIPVPASLLEHLSTDRPLLHHADPESSTTGLLLLPEGPLLTASRPIVTSEGEGSIRGTLLMGRYLDAAQIKHLAEVTHLSLTLHRLDDAEMPLDFQAARSALSEEVPIFMRPLSAHSVAGYALLQDICGEASLLLRVDRPRDIYAQGRTTLFYLASAGLAVIVLFGVVIIFYIENSVLSRVSRLSAGVSRIGGSGDLSVRVWLPGRDELSSLAEAINGMLAALEHAQQERKQAEEARRQSEERYRAVVESALAGISIVDPEENIIFNNEAAARMLGYRQDELVGKNLSQFMDPEEFQRMREMTKLRQAGVSSHYECTLRHKDGATLNLLVSVAPLTAPDGSFVGSIGVLVDMTEQRRAEEQVQRHLVTEEAIAQALSLFISPGGTDLHQVLKVLGEAVRVNRAYIFRAREDGSKGDNTHEWCAPGTEPQIDHLQDLDAASFPWWMEKLERGENIVIPDVDALPPEAAAEKEILQAQDIRSLLVVPIHSTLGKLVGFMGFDDTEKCREWASEEVQALRVVAARVGAHWEQQEAEKALRESEEKYRNVVERANDGIAIIQDGIVKYVNLRLAAMGDGSVEEFVGTPFTDHLHPDELPEVVDHYKRRMAGEDVPPIYETVFMRKDGSKVYAELNAGLITYQDRPADLVIVRDITERKQAAEEVKRHAVQLATLHEVSTAVTSHLSPQGIFDTVIRSLSAAFGYRLIGLYLLENGRLELKAHLGYGSAPSPAVAHVPLEKGVLGRTARTGQPQWVTHVEEDPDFFYGMPGITSEVSVPLKRGNEVLGVLNVESDRVDRPLDTSDLQLLTLLGNHVVIALENARLYEEAQQQIAERKQAEAALKASEARYRGLFDGVPIGVYRATPDGEIFEANPALVEMLGFPDQETLLATDMRDLYWNWEERQHALALAEREGSTSRCELQMYRHDGEVIWVQDTFRVVRDAQGNPLYYEGALQDMTAQKALQAQLLQAQKMEAVGRLAGGVAHDFNNLLTAIIAYASFAKETLPSADPSREDIDQVLLAAERAGILTSRLLAFSRRQVLEPRLINLNDVVLDTDKLLRRLIGEDIELVIMPGSDLGLVKADPRQIEQALVNLVVNARDAMPTGGRLIIETANVTINEDPAHLERVAPGEYVMLSISDTGVGMTEEVKAHLFEPFFTTKEVGKGTGLGLATVYGIVKQHQGNVRVYSEPGRGTTVIIYLPRAEGEAEKLPRRDEAGYLPQGSETVLVVEDEPIVRGLATRILNELGYSVLEAADGNEALQVAQAYAGEIHLLLTDVVMPKMGGKALADQLIALRPKIKVLFMSGYTDDTIIHHGVTDEGIAFLQKPFPYPALARKVREVLNR